jgi:hypothetical protein
MDVLANNKKESRLDATQIPDNAQYYYTEEEKEEFANDPEKHLQYRLQLEQSMNGLFRTFIRGSNESSGARQVMREERIRRLGSGQEKLVEKLIPSWAPGCGLHLVAKILPMLTAPRPTYNSWRRLSRSSGRD